MSIEGNPAWLNAYPQLAQITDSAWQELMQKAQLRNIPAGTVLFYSGDRAAQYVLVLEGSIKVQKITENGREIVLYRVEPGETCVLTTNSLLAMDTYPAEGIAETAVKAVVLPSSAFQQAMADSPSFRQFVFSVYGRRLSDLILLVEEVAFGRMDQRLAQFLLHQAEEGEVLQLSHQELAAELGTAREVVSRLLKEFERRGWVSLARRQITVVDKPAMRLGTESTVL